MVHELSICPRQVLVEPLAFSRNDLQASFFATSSTVSPSLLFPTDHHSAERGRADCVELLLKAGAAKDSQDNDGGTPLHCAAERGHAECVDLLLKQQLYAVGVALACGEVERRPTQLWSFASLSVPALRDLEEHRSTFALLSWSQLTAKPPQVTGSALYRARTTR